MAAYRRCYVPGESFFFTVVTERRAAILGDNLLRHVLRTAFRACRQRWPFRVDALVMLREHLHAIWALPLGDTDYSNCWGAIKKHYTQSWLALPSARDMATAILGAYAAGWMGLRTAFRLPPLQSGQTRVDGLPARLVLFHFRLPGGTGRLRSAMELRGRRADRFFRSGGNGR